jgi:hypothetical protein
MSRSTTLVLALGAAVLVIALFIGQGMGDRVMQQATGQQEQAAEPSAIPSAANGSPQPYGPDWKRSQSLSAAGDPHFPDPRVPPQPIPTLAPTPKPVITATPVPTPTPNRNIPIWRQQPLPTVEPSSPEESPVPPPPEGSPEPSPTPE